MPWHPHKKFAWFFFGGKELRRPNGRGESLGSATSMIMRSFEWIKRTSEYHIRLRVFVHKNHFAPFRWHEWVLKAEWNATRCFIWTSQHLRDLKGLMTWNHWFRLALIWGVSWSFGCRCNLKVSHRKCNAQAGVHGLSFLQYFWLLQVQQAVSSLCQSQRDESKQINPFTSGREEPGGFSAFTLPFFQYRFQWKNYRRFPSTIFWAKALLSSDPMTQKGLPNPESEWIHLALYESVSCWLETTGRLRSQPTVCKSHHAAVGTLLCISFFFLCYVCWLVCFISHLFMHYLHPLLFLFCPRPVLTSFYAGFFQILLRCCLAPQGSGKLDFFSVFSVSEMAWWSRRFWWRFWGKGPGREGAAAKSFRSWFALTQIRMPKIQHGFQFQTSSFSLLALRIPNMGRRPRLHVTKLHRKGQNIFRALGNSTETIEGFDHGFVLEPSSWGALEESSWKDREGQMFQLWRVFKGHQTQTPWSN